MKWLTSKRKQEPKPTLEEERAEKLAEMGAQLWTKRLEQGLSLEEMVILTKISRRLLQAIEEGNLNELPEPIYTQGLIRQYANALGFNGAEFTSTYPIGINRVTLKPTWKPAPFGRLRPVHLYLLYIVMIICSVSGLSQVLTNATTIPAAKYSQNKDKSAVKLPQSQKIPKTQPAQVKAVSNNNQKVQIGVTLKASSWIRVVADGKTQFEGVLPEGTHRTWKAQGELTVKAGNAGSVLVSVNQEKAKQLGNPGEVQEVRIAARNRE